MSEEDHLGDNRVSPREQYTDGQVHDLRAAGFRNDDVDLDQ